MFGVAKDADQKNIKDTFRNLALKYHPDRNKGPAPGANIEVDLSISLERIAKGGEETIRFFRLITCHACHPGILS